MKDRNFIPTYEKRDEELMSSLIHSIRDVSDLKKSQCSNLILSSPTDLGVARNLGRRGSRFAPECIINLLKKMALHSEKKIGCYQVSFESEEKLSYIDSLHDESMRISKAIKSIKKKSKIIHLGGGHDHVYSLLSGIHKTGVKKFKILNIDAHCDSRSDSFPHSGTPFRHFFEDHPVSGSLIQFGIHYYTNTKSTLSPIPNCSLTYIDDKTLYEETDYFRKSVIPYLEKIISFESDDDDKDVAYILSLDVDALAGDIMEGVSAVNYNGIKYDTVLEVTDWFKNKIEDKNFICGIYEYNPLYDNLSQKGARVIASLIYSYFRDTGTDFLSS